MSEIKEFVVFRLEGEHYGIDIHNVENIEKPIAITRIPYTDKYVKGVVNLRGNIIPVIDLRERFSLPVKDFDDETRIIIVNVNELNVGMIVDSSSEVLQLEDEDIEEAPKVQGYANIDFVNQIGKHEQRIIMLIDLIKVLGIENIDIE